MIALTLGFVLALCIGGACRRFEVPVPAPSRLLGALLVVSMTLGYLGADWLLR